MSNPYIGLYEAMGRATKLEPSFFIGKVKSGFPNLVVVTNDLPLDKDVLSINISLKELKDEIKTGDEVLLVKVQKQYIVLCKVVSI